jgi:imidazolonepropionase-like amidohydrolase
MSVFIHTIRSFLSLLLLIFCFQPAGAQTPFLLLPERVFDGENMHEDWVVLVSGTRIQAAGPRAIVAVPEKVVALELTGMTLMPGLIEGHGHLFLHPYNETSWNDQVLRESIALRVARATVHARKTLEAGFTTFRDLGTEGAGYADAGLKTAIEQNIIPGPRLIIAGKAIVATGSYGPKGFRPDMEVPLGAEPADGHELPRVVRDQIGKGADLIKVYADYRWGPSGEAMPTFSVEELKLIVETAASSGRPVVAHASTSEGMRRAVEAGVQTIEHGDGGNEAIFRFMAERGVALCPTLAAGDAIMQYRGWRKGSEPDPDRIRQKKESFRQALESGVTIVAGGDVGVFPHGENARELLMMVDYGMAPVDVLRSATSVSARVMGLADQVGRIKPGLQADLIAVEGNPLTNMQKLYRPAMVMREGALVITP